MTPGKNSELSELTPEKNSELSEYSEWPRKKNLELSELTPEKNLELSKYPELRSETTTLIWKILTDSEIIPS